MLDELDGLDRPIGQAAWSELHPNMLDDASIVGPVIRPLETFIGKHLVDALLCRSVLCGILIRQQCPRNEQHDMRISMCSLPASIPSQTSSLWTNTSWEISHHHIFEGKF